MKREVYEISIDIGIKREGNTIFGTRFNWEGDALLDTDDRTALAEQLGALVDKINTYLDTEFIFYDVEET